MATDFHLRVIKETLRAPTLLVAPGLRLRHGLACVDATVSGLLASRERIAAVHDEIDLPIDAYLDRGFQNWLKHVSED